MAKQVAKATDKSTSVAKSYQDDFAAHAGAGMENVGANDVLIPRLTILQKLSPQIDKKKTEFISGAEVGDICDVGTGDLYREGIIFIPAHYSKVWLEWAPRSSGKGLVDIHQDGAILEKCQRNDKNQPILDNGNLISETAQFFGMNVTADFRRSFIPLASTQLKKARRWMTLATGEKLKRADGSSFIPPLFYRSYKLTTAEESNNDGDWVGWKVERDATLPELGEAMGFNWKELKDELVAFHDTVAKGGIRGDIASPEDAGPVAGGEGAM